MTKKTTKKFDFEKSLTRLEELVDEMDGEQTNLEKAIQNFEEGMKLSKSCEDYLNQAQGRIEKITKEHTGQTNIEDISDQFEDE